MPFLIALLFIFIMLLIAPLIKFVAVRMTLRSEIIKVCKKRGFSFTPATKRAFTGSLNRPTCDFHVETDSCIWSVKILGFATKKVILRFENEQRVDVCEKSLRRIAISDIPEKKFVREELPAYDFKLNSPSAKKPRRKLYLLCPSVYDHVIKTGDILLPKPSAVGRINLLYAKEFLEELDGRSDEVGES